MIRILLVFTLLVSTAACASVDPVKQRASLTEIEKSLAAELATGTWSSYQSKLKTERAALEKLGTNCAPARTAALTGTLKALCHQVTVGSYALLTDLPLADLKDGPDPASIAGDAATNAKPLCEQLGRNPYCPAINALASTLPLRRASAELAAMAFSSAPDASKATTYFQQMHVTLRGDAFANLPASSQPEAVSYTHLTLPTTPYV